MRRLVVSGLLLLLGLTRFAFATDYELTIDSPSPSLLKAKSLTIYEQFGLIKPGDRIVSIAEGPLPVPSMGCKIFPGAGEKSVVINAIGTLPGFPGEIRLGSGDPGNKGVSAALLVHVVSPPPSRKSVIITKVGGFFETYPFVWFIIGGGLLVALGIGYWRLIAQQAGSTPIYGKRAYEENLRDVKARLEQILASQEELVKKPPVLRFYKHQIDGFDKRLGHLEHMANSSQQSLTGATAGIADLHKGLEGLGAQEKSSRQVIDNLLSTVENKASDQQRATEALRVEAKSQTANLESLAQSLAKRIEEQAHQSDAQTKALSGEIAKLQQHLAEANTHIGELKTELSQAEQVNAERAGQVAKLGERLESIVPSAVSTIGDQVKALGAALDSTQRQNLGASEQVAAGLQGISVKIESLSALSGSVSSLNGEILALGARIEDLGGSVKDSASQSGEFHTKLATALSLESSQISEARELLVKLETGVARVREESAKSQAASEATGAALKGLYGQVEKLADEAATREQVDSLNELPKSVTKLEQSLTGALGKLSEAGLSKDDLRAMLTAHQKLSALPEELSQMLQKSLEQKLAGLVAQSLTAKKGADSKDGSEQNATVLGEVAKQLLAEIEHQKTLELAFANLRSSLEGVPDSIARLEQRLETPSGAPQGLTLAEYEASMGEIKAKLAAIPDAVTKLAARVEEVAVSGGQGPPAPVANPEIPARLDKLDEKFSSVSAQWEQANKRLDETLRAVAGLAQQQAVAAKQAPPELKKEAAPKLEVVAESAPPLVAAALNPAVAEMPTEESEPVHLVLEQSAPVAGAEQAVQEQEPELAVEAQPEPEVEEEELEVVDHGASLFSDTRDPAQEWAFAGDINGMWQASSSRHLKPNGDSASAIRPLTPTETPGIEYEIGAMLYSGKRVIYAHGDSIRAFWPGEAERSMLLSHAVPNEPWRLLMLGETLFCAQENRVETIDLANWSRSAAFAGVYTNQCATKEYWVGIRKGKPGSVLEFRDSAGELVGDLIPLPPSFTGGFYLVSDGEAAYVAGSHGEVLKATPSEVQAFCKVTAGGISNFVLTENGPVALSLGPENLLVTKFDLKGKAAATLELPASELSGNVAVLGDRLFVFDAGARALCSCDLATMKVLAPVDLGNVERMRRMIALNAGSIQSLLIAGCDSGGKLGSVFLLDPATNAHLTLCSTNQPCVEAIFADGCPVVATSSSYQNIIRVFQPFVAVKSKAA